jgi:hypothetical protein
MIIPVLALIGGVIAIAAISIPRAPLTRPAPSGSAPFCRDCRWCLPRRDFLGRRTDFDSARCMHAAAPLSKEEVLVTGTFSEDNALYCSVMRRSGRCGPDGKLWENW